MNDETPNCLRNLKHHTLLWSKKKNFPWYIRQSRMLGKNWKVRLWETEVSKFIEAFLGAPKFRSPTKIFAVYFRSTVIPPSYD